MFVHNYTLYSVINKSALEAPKEEAPPEGDEESWLL